MWKGVFEMTNCVKYPNILSELGRVSMPKYKLAEMLDVDRKTLDSWISKGNIPAPKLVQMADIFKVSIDYLLGRTEIRLIA